MSCVQCCASRKCLSSPRCRSELIDSAVGCYRPWTKKCMKKIKIKNNSIYDLLSIIPKSYFIQGHVSDFLLHCTLVHVKDTLTERKQQLQFDRY